MEQIEALLLHVAVCVCRGGELLVWLAVRVGGMRGADKSLLKVARVVILGVGCGARRSGLQMVFC